MSCLFTPFSSPFTRSIQRWRVHEWIFNWRNKPTEMYGPVCESRGKLCSDNTIWREDRTINKQVYKLSLYLWSGPPGATPPGANNYPAPRTYSGDLWPYCLHPDTSVISHIVNQSRWGCSSFNFGASRQ